MRLMTQEVRDRLPALGSTDGAPIESRTVPAKFFTPWSCWTWYALEFDGDDTFFGYVEGLEPEFGYFSLSELESLRGPAGLRVERDLYLAPTTKLVDLCPALRAAEHA